MFPHSTGGALILLGTSSRGVWTVVYWGAARNALRFQDVCGKKTALQGKHSSFQETPGTEAPVVLVSRRY